MKLQVFLGMVLVVLVTVSLGTADQRLEQSRRDLDVIRQQIEQTSESLEEKQQTARGINDQLAKVEREFRRAQQKVSALRKKIDDLQGKISRQEKEIEQDKARIREVEAEVRKRLVALYKSGDAQLVKVLFSGNPPAEIFENYNFLQRLVRHDQELIDRYLVQLRKNEQQLTAFAELKREREGALQQKRAEEKRLSDARNQKKNLLAKLHKDQKALSMVLANLEEKAARLSDLVKRLESKKPETYTEKSTAFASRRGRLPWPAKGALRLGFGQGIHPELGTRYDSHGLEIAVAGVVPIRTVWDGQVVFANEFRGYGNLMIIDHGDGYYSLYAQASRLVKRVGEQVSAGDTIAYSGFDGGDAVYFEIRQGGTPLDPAGWLVKRP